MTDQSAVLELRGLLGPPAGPVTISHRHIAPMLGAAISERVDAKHAVAWLSGALAELHSTLAAQSKRAVAPGGRTLLGRALRQRARCGNDLHSL